MKKLIFILLSVIVLFSCSSSEKSVKEDDKVELDELEVQEVRLEINSLNSWINLMPGAESKFHISGELRVERNYKYDLKFITINKIVVSQDNQQIYSIVPLVQVDYELSSESGKYLRFSTVRGLSRDPRLDINKPVEFEIIFDDGNETYSYNLENVEINKVY